MNIFDRIDNILSTQKISRRKLAYLANIKPSTLGSMFNRKKGIKVETTRAIASALNVPINYLLGIAPFDNMAVIDNMQEVIIYSLSKCIGFDEFLKKNHISRLQDITYIQYLGLVDKYLNRIDLTNDDGKGFLLSYKTGVVPPESERNNQRREVRHVQAVNALLKLPGSQRDAIYTIIETMSNKED